MLAKGKIKKILVVDDDRIVTTLLSSRLTDNGYEVTEMTDAGEGLEYALKYKPDLIILDVMMPIINGYNFCRLLKEEKGQKDILVVLLTSRNQMQDIKIGMEMGADAYLVKPINMEELLRTINVLESGGQ